MLSSAARSFSAAALRRARVPAHTSVRFSGAAASAPFRGRAVAPISATAGGAAAAAPAPAPYPPLRVTAPGRVVALGDVHGDIGQARRALRIAGVLGDGGDAVNPEWVGGNTVVVQVGDVLDRGDDEIAILILLQKLHKQARQSGGAVYILNGNHEVLNVSGDFRYVTQGAFQESTRFGEHLVNLFGKPFEDAFGGGEPDPRKKQVKARAGLFSPGGPLAQQLAMNRYAEPTVSQSNARFFFPAACVRRGAAREYRRDARGGTERVLPTRRARAVTTRRCPRVRHCLLAAHKSPPARDSLTTDHRILSRSQHRAHRERHRVRARRFDAAARGVRSGEAEQRGGGLDAGRGDRGRGGPNRAGDGDRERQGQRCLEPNLRHGKFRHPQ